jgi:Sec-independent protein translocase protein TatA
MGEFKRARNDFEDEIRMAEMEASTETDEKKVTPEEAKHKEEASASEDS